MVWSWGADLWQWRIGSPSATKIAPGPFNEGGCLVDINSDGQLDVVLQEGTGLGRLVWLQAPGWQRHEIDTEIEMHDCQSATIDGHRGFLMVQRFSQIRFYERTGGKWHVQDVYSIYTASHQSGLLQVDIDGDGRLDLLCGNYWAKAPDSFEMPWRIFAINVMHEEPDSARVRTAVLNGASTLVVSQGFLEKGRVVQFERPFDPKVQWQSKDLLTKEKPRYPKGLAISGEQILVGEDNGTESRLFILSTRGAVKQRPHMPVQRLLIWRGQLISIGHWDLQTERLE